MYLVAVFATGSRGMPHDRRGRPRYRLCSLLFCWKVSLVKCQKRLCSFVAEVGIMAVLLLYYLDGLLVLGVCKEKTRKEAQLLVKCVKAVGVFVSTKSMFACATRLC